jgi:LysR family transcriptional regulator for bpeEF and oprC
MDRLLSYKVFLRVAELGSFGRAAHDLGMAAATISTHIAQLESHLGVTLVHRTTRSIKLSEEGRTFYERAARIIADMEQLEQSIAGGDQPPHGRLRVEVAPTTALQLVVPALPGFRQRYPEIRLEIGVNTRYVDLVQEGADCAIRVGHLPDSTLISRPLGFVRLRTYASPHYLAARGTPRTPEELSGHDCILLLSPSTGRPTEWQFEQAGERRSMAVHGPLACGTLEACAFSAALGLGITQIVSLAARDYVASGRLTAILTPWAAQGAPMQIVYPHSRVPSPRLRAFIEYFGATIPEVLLND